MARLIARFARDDSGATAIEYGVIIGLISVGLIGALTLMGSGVSGKFEFIANRLN